MQFRLKERHNTNETVYFGSDMAEKALVPAGGGNLAVVGPTDLQSAHSDNLAVDMREGALARGRSSDLVARVVDQFENFLGNHPVLGPSWNALPSAERDRIYSHCYAAVAQLGTLAPEHTTWGKTSQMVLALKTALLQEGFPKEGDYVSDHIGVDGNTSKNQIWRLRNFVEVSADFGPKLCGYLFALQEARPDWTMGQVIENFWTSRPPERVWYPHSGAHGVANTAQWPDWIKRESDITRLADYMQIVVTRAFEGNQDDLFRRSGEAAARILGDERIAPALYIYPETPLRVDRCGDLDTYRFPSNAEAFSRTSNLYVSLLAHPELSGVILGTLSASGLALMPQEPHRPSRFSLAGLKRLVGWDS